MQERKIYTIAIDKLPNPLFITALLKLKIKQIIDIREKPNNARHKNYKSKSLSKLCSARKVTYEHRTFSTIENGSIDFLTSQMRFPCCFLCILSELSDTPRIKICRLLEENFPIEHIVFNGRKVETIIHEEVASAAEVDLETSVNIKTAFIWSHHIRGPDKLKVIEDGAKQFDLTGFCVTGWPGIIVVEGDPKHITIYYERVSRLAWRACRLCDTEESHCTSLEAGRKYPDFVIHRSHKEQRTDLDTIHARLEQGGWADKFELLTTQTDDRDR